jgi:hypothetical protein
MEYANVHLFLGLLAQMRTILSSKENCFSCHSQAHHQTLAETRDHRQNSIVTQADQCAGDHHVHHNRAGKHSVQFVHCVCVGGEIAYFLSIRGDRRVS